jgi:vacuolar-type H+-ATPase subunit I/STV1
MFSATPMLRLEIIVFARDTRMVLQVIGQAGAMQFLQTPVDSDQELLSVSDQKDAIAQCDNLLARITEIRRTLNIHVDREMKSPTEIIPIQTVIDTLSKLEDRAEELTELKRRVSERREGLNALRGQVAEYFGLDVPLQKLRDLTYLHFVIGSMPENNLPSIHVRHDLELFLLPKSKVSERRSIAILSRRQNKNDIESMLDKLD